MYFLFYLTLTLAFCFLINKNETDNKAKELFLLSVTFAFNARAVRFDFSNFLCFLRSGIFATASQAQVVLFRKGLLRLKHKLNFGPFCGLANEK